MVGQKHGVMEVALLNQHGLYDEAKLARVERPAPGSRRSRSPLRSPALTHMVMLEEWQSLRYAPRAARRPSVREARGGTAQLRLTRCSRLR
jgi:hypothetical protein